MSAQDLAGLAARARDAAVRAGTGLDVREVEPITGGHSGLTLAAELVDPDGRTRPVVIKAAPEGRRGIGRHDVLRQARLFEALRGAPGVAVPEVYFTDDEDPPLFGMSRLAGECVEPILSEGIDLVPTEVATRSFASADLLAALHAVDPATVGLDQLEPTATVRDELERWRATMGAVDPDIVPGGPELGDRLAARVPEPVRPAVVHGDFRLGNLLCDGGEVTGAIDWEIWTVTDPRLDLGWYLVHFDADNYPGIGHRVDGLPGPEQVLARYEASAGEVADMPWFDAFGRFKLAAIMAHNLRRHREGRHVDPFQERLPPTIALQIRTGTDLLDPA